MSLTCHEEIGRVGRECYEDPRGDVHNMFVRVGPVEFGERHDTRTNGQHYTAADRRPTNHVSAWKTGRGSRPTRRHRREETAFVEFKLKPRCKPTCISRAWANPTRSKLEFQRVTNERRDCKHAPGIQLIDSSTTTLRHGAPAAAAAARVRLKDDKLRASSSQQRGTNSCMPACLQSRRFVHS